MGQIPNELSHSSRVGSTTFNAKSEYVLALALEEKKGVATFVVLLQEVDVQKALDVGIEVAGKYGGTFNGLTVFTIGINPPRDKQALNFFLDATKVGEVVGEITKRLVLPREGYLVNATPTSQYIPRARPAQTAT